MCIAVEWQRLAHNPSIQHNQPTHHRGSCRAIEEGDMAEKAGVVSVRTERAPSRLLLPLIITGFLAVMLAWLGLTQFLNALTLGAVYALIALGYTMVYGIIELINFAHGDVFMVGTFVSMFVSEIGRAHV